MASVGAGSVGGTGVGSDGGTGSVGGTGSLGVGSVGGVGSPETNAQGPAFRRFITLCPPFSLVNRTFITDLVT